MSIGSILLIIALIIMLLLYLLRPFLTPNPLNETRTSHQKLLAQKEQLLDQIRTLDFDHTTSKIPAEVYQSQRDHLISQAALIAQQLDSHSINSDDIEVEIETAVAQLRSPQPQGTQTTTLPKKQSSRFCPQCGQAIDEGDKFCATCGHQLVEAIGN